MALYNGEGGQAAGYLGEATLRLLGVSASAISALKARVPTKSVVGGSDALQGLRDVRNATPALQQTSNNTCGLHAAGHLLDDVGPAARPISKLNLSGTEGDYLPKLLAENSGGLDSYRRTQFIQRNSRGKLFAQVEREVNEIKLESFLNEGKEIIAHVDGNHWVRVLGVVEDGGKTWVRVYDSGRGSIYEQLISSFMTRAGVNNQMVVVRKISTR